MRHEIDKVKETHKGHFFVSSILEWHTGRDLPRMVKRFQKEQFPYAVFYVPVPEDYEYLIKNYAPQVDGAVCICTYGMDRLSE